MKSENYSPETKPVAVRESKEYQDENSKYTVLLYAERDRAIALLANKAKKARYRDLVEAIDKFTSMIMLMEGKPIEHIQSFSLERLFIASKGINAKRLLNNGSTSTQEDMGIKQEDQSGVQE